MSATALVVALAGSVGAAWLVCRLLKRFADGDGSAPLVPRTPSVRFVAQPGFPGPDSPSRAEHIEAIRALCAADETYTRTRLALYEPDVSHMAELLLELDDQSPRPDDGDRGFVAE